jgi:hypothetical protein
MTITLHHFLHRTVAGGSWTGRASIGRVSACERYHTTGISPGGSDQRWKGVVVRPAHCCAMLGILDVGTKRMQRQQAEFQTTIPDHPPYRTRLIGSQPNRTACQTTRRAFVSPTANGSRRMEHSPYGGARRTPFNTTCPTYYFAPIAVHAADTYHRPSTRDRPGRCLCNPFFKARHSTPSRQVNAKTDQETVFLC